MRRPKHTDSVADATGAESTAPESPADEEASPAAPSVAAPDAPTEAAADAGAPPSAADAALAALEAQLADQRDKYVRLAADYENSRKRAVRERQEAELKGMGHLVRGILDALDDLGRFAHVDPDVTEAHTLQQGVEMVEKKLLKSLAGHGLEVVNPLGQPFDPAVHEAVTTMPAESADEDHLVAQVYQVGYVFNGQLLRPARVVVKQWSAPQ